MNNCKICGKVLHDPESIKKGMGPVCYSRNHRKMYTLKPPKDELEYIDTERIKKIFGWD